MGKNPRKLYNIFVFSAFPKIGKKKIIYKNSDGSQKELKPQQNLFGKSCGIIFK